MSKVSIWEINPMVDNAIDCVAGIWFEVVTKSQICYRIKGVLDQQQFIDEQGDHYTVQRRLEVSVQTNSLSFDPTGVYLRVDDEHFPQFADQWYLVNSADDNVNGRTTLTLVKSCDPPKQDQENLGRSARAAKYSSSEYRTRSQRFRSKGKQSNRKYLNERFTR